MASVSICRYVYSVLIIDYCTFTHLLEAYSEQQSDLVLHVIPTNTLIQLFKSLLYLHLTLSLLVAAFVVCNNTCNFTVSNQTRHDHPGSDLDPECLRLSSYSWNDFMKIICFKQISRRQKACDFTQHAKR